MPQLFLPINDTMISVVRPVVYSIIKELFTITNIPEDTFISYPGDLEALQQPGSDINKISQQNGINTMPYSDRIFIEVDEDYEMDRILSTAIYRVENTFIFRDDRVEVGIRPVYSSTDTTINFKYRTKDKAAGMRWRDNIKNMVSMNVDQRIHKVGYHFLIPIEYLIILKEIHRLMENVEGYGVKLNEYLVSGFTKRATVMSTQAGTELVWAISESQIRIVGVFDFELIPEKGNRDDDSDTWTISFAYKFRYDKPTACTMQYPLMIHNQLLPQEYRNNILVDKTDPLDGKKFDFSLSSELFYKFQKDTQMKALWNSVGFNGYSIPSYDEFIPGGILPNTIRIFTALINIDVHNPHKLLSLKELGDLKINHNVLKFMVGEMQYMTIPNMSILAISMYRNGSLLDNTALTMDADLNVYATYILTLRKYYHIRLSIVKDLTRLSEAAIDRLRNHGKAALVLLDYINPYLHKRKQLPAILGNDYITRDAMRKCIGIMNNIDPNPMAMKTVQTLIIQSAPLGIKE